MIFILLWVFFQIIVIVKIFETIFHRCFVNHLNIYMRAYLSDNMDVKQESQLNWLGQI